MSRGTESLGKTPLFAGLPPEAIRDLDSHCTWRVTPAGEWVIDVQSDTRDVFFVISGHLQIVIPWSGREIIFGDLRDGEFVGDLSAIDGEQHRAGVRAVVDTLNARMSAAVFRDSIHRYPVVCDRVLAAIVREFRNLATRTRERIYLGVRERLCAELLRLSRPVAGGRIVISPPPTHVELAARVTTHREAVTKMLNALEREGAIARSRAAITLLDPDRLRRIVEGEK